MLRVPGLRLTDIADDDAHAIAMMRELVGRLGWNDEQSPEEPDLQGYLQAERR